MVEIENIPKLCDVLVKLIDEEFTIDAEQNNIICNYNPFNFVAKEKDKIIGILTGYACYDEIYIHELIVFRGYRKQGIGMKLISEVEKNFTNKGFNNINLVTNKFQAPDFYKKCGFTLEFVRKNKENPKLAKYYFVKYF